VHPLRSLVAAAVVLNIAASAAQEPDVVVFKSGVERVALAAVVRDSRGKLVRNLEARDFVLFDSGRARPLLSVWSEPSSASVALLVDASGSMATKIERARETARALVAGLKPGFDEVAYFTFDTALEEVRPFSKDFSITDVPLEETKAYGATSLWDAIAAAAERMADRQQRRALVVITDGVDSASKLKPSVVSAIASELDVPVYILVISFALDDDQREIPMVTGPLADLATWTGGDSFPVRDLVSAATATNQVLAELNHQYVIAFEPGRAPGWHPLVLRARKPGLFVRVRSGYTVK
jgi:Ca-activated chloride channel family protein